MEEFNIDDVPNLSPKVEELLMICLRSEVDAYSQSLRGVRCMLCPFRSFSRLPYLKRHLQHHCAKNITLIIAKRLFQLHQRGLESLTFCITLLPKFGNGIVNALSLS